MYLAPIIKVSFLSFPSHNEERGEETGSGRGKGRKERAGEKGRAAKERLTRKRKPELGETLDGRVKGCLGGVNRVNESVTRRGGREEEGREGRRERADIMEKCCLGQFLSRSLEDAIFAAD